MKNYPPVMFGKLARTVGLAGTGLSLALAASAQSTAAATDENDTLKLERFVVTGSNLPSAGETPVAPISLLTPEIIEHSGITNDLLQVIRKTAPQFTGNANLGGDNGNIASGSTNGGSALALRNLPTLVLVNGRRMTAAPVASTGGGVFVDVNAIPVSAIERVEILTDGASAIYGTDAVSGVVNIILKTDFQGAEVGGRYAVSTHEGRSYEERSAYGVAGGQIGANGPKVTASFEWVKTDPLYNYERPFATPVYGTTYFAGVVQLGAFDADGNFIGNNRGYYYLDPSLNGPKAGATLADRGYTTGPIGAGDVSQLFNLSQYVTMIIGNEKKIGTVSVTGKLSATTSYFGDILYSHTSNASQLNAQPVDFPLTASDPNNVLGLDLDVRNRFVSTPRTYRQATDSYRIVGGMKGSLNDQWTWESAVDYSYGKQDFANGGLVRSAAREEAVNAGKIKLFERDQPAGALDGVFGEAIGIFKSTLASIDLKFVGRDVFMLPAGGVNLAVGAEARTEKLTAASDADSQSATFAFDSGTSTDPFGQKHEVYSGFAEVNLPLVSAKNRIPGIYSADLTLAGRYENYSDTSDPAVPKIALRYQPAGDSFMFRFTFSKSFQAPTLYQLNAPTGIGFTSTLAEFDSLQAKQVTQPVTGLTPSWSRNFSAGFVWSPKNLPGFLLSVDYFNIKQSDVVGNLGLPGVVDQVFHDVEVNGTASPYAKYVHVSSATGPLISAPGQISSLGLDNLYFVIPAASNLGAAKMSGFDTRLEYTWKLSDAGKIHFSSAGTYYANYDLQIAPTAPYTPTAGLVTGLNGTIPRWRMYNQLSWERGPWTVDVGQTFYSSTTDTTWDPSYLPDGYEQKIPAYITYDASASYVWSAGWGRLKDVKLTLGVNNIADRLPTKSATFDSLSNADIAEFSPIGRLYYVTMSVKF
ncbi:MAG: TonB-dependent receptor plug domain-containing protein [Lacunisphaera sp.]